MGGYYAMIRVFKEKPEYVPIIRKCIEVHREKQKQALTGFEWDDVKVFPVRLVVLATKYDLLDVTYKSNSST